MRLVTFRRVGGDEVGVWRDDHISPLPPALGDLVDIIGILGEGEQSLADVAAADRIPISDVRLVAPIRRFRRDILCTGWNYWAHFEEGVGRRADHEVDRPERPTFFTKGPDTVIGPYDDIGYDGGLSKEWDYEAELALVIGKAGRTIPRERALDHVFGYLLANDVSVRDLQRAHGGQWLKGKSIDGTLPLGPCVVTADELGDPQDVELECVVNGEVRQQASTRLMAFDVATLISELSYGMTLRPGDVLLTGTPAGVGHARTPQLFLTAGDEVVVRSPQIGELRNRLARTELA